MCLSLSLQACHLREKHGNPEASQGDPWKIPIYSMLSMTRIIPPKGEYPPRARYQITSNNLCTSLCINNVSFYIMYQIAKQSKTKPSLMSQCTLKISKQQRPTLKSIPLKPIFLTCDNDEIIDKYQISKPNKNCLKEINNVFSKYLAPEILQEIRIRHQD